MNFMIYTMEALALILARGGSKGIPLKNIQKLAGNPLIKYSIDCEVIRIGKVYAPYTF